MKWQQLSVLLSASLFLHRIPVTWVVKEKRARRLDKGHKYIRMPLVDVWLNCFMPDFEPVFLFSSWHPKGIFFLSWGPEWMMCRGSWTHEMVTFHKTCFIPVNSNSSSACVYFPKAFEFPRWAESCFGHETMPRQKLRGFSPRANYTDRATAACRRSQCHLLWIEDVAWSEQRIPKSVILRF
jgi:hypothetical protein